jgi:hypothetical protein
MSGQNPALFAELQKLLDTKRMPMVLGETFETDDRVVSLTEMATGDGRRTVLMRADEFEAGSYVIQRNKDNTLSLVGFERTGGDPLTAQKMFGLLPGYGPVFIQFGAECRNDGDDSEDEDEEDSNSYKEVVIQFDTQEALDTAEGDMFDTVYEAFNAGLPDGWYADDCLELVGDASGKVVDHVRYNGSMTPVVVKVEKKTKKKARTAENQKRKRTEK